jgi:hypothetical protein
VNRLCRSGLLALPIVGCCVIQAFAQGNIDFKARVDSKEVGLGAQIVLTLTLTGSPTQGIEPEVPPIDGFAVMRSGVSSNISIINGQMASSTECTYVLTATEVGRHVIPPLKVQIAGQTYTSQAIAVDVTQTGPTVLPQNPNFPPGIPWSARPSVPPPRPAANAPPVFVEATVSTHHPYVNEGVLYTFKLFHRVNLDGPPNFEPAETTGFLRDEMGQATSNEIRNGQSYAISEVRTMLFPSTAGEATIGSTRLTLRLRPDGDPFADSAAMMFDFNPIKELVTKSIIEDVMPLPTAGRPDDFSGAVGQFTLKAKLTPDHVKEGESTTLELTAEGSGHPDLISDIPLPPFPNLKVYPSTSESRTDHQGEFHGVKTYRFPIVAEKAGTFKLAGLRLSYFDPRKNRYELAEAPAPILIVKADPTFRPARPSATPQPAASPQNDSSRMDQDVLHPLKSIPALEKPTAPLTGRSWFWILQLLPLTLLVGAAGARRLSATMRRLSSSRYHSQASVRYARQARRLARDQVDQATGLIYTYLREKTGQNFSTLSLARVRERLTRLGVSDELGALVSEKLEQLESLRYAPPELRDDGPQAGDLAAELIEKLERQL